MSTSRLNSKLVAIFETAEFTSAKRSGGRLELERSHLDLVSAGELQKSLESV